MAGLKYTCLPELMLHLVKSEFKSDRGGIEIRYANKYGYALALFKSDRGGIEILLRNALNGAAITFKSDRGGIEINESVNTFVDNTEFKSDRGGIEICNSFPDTDYSICSNQTVAGLK